MPYLQTIIDYFEDNDFVIPEDNDAQTLYEQLEKDWKPNNRFPIWKILGDDLPDFIIWLQEQIDEEQPDETPIFDKEEKEIDELRKFIESEVLLEPENSVNEEFEDISRILKRDNRPALDKVLRGNKKEFLDFIRSRLSGVSDEPETDESTGSIERAVEPIERGIDSLLQGATNLLGTPMRLLEELVLPIIREPVRIVEGEIVKTGIVQSIKGFLRGLFS